MSTPEKPMLCRYPGCKRARPGNSLYCASHRNTRVLTRAAVKKAAKKAAKKVARKAAKKARRR